MAIDFSFPEEVTHIVSKVHEFCEQVVSPGQKEIEANEGDREILVRYFLGCARVRCAHVQRVRGRRVRGRVHRDRGLEPEPQMHAARSTTGIFHPQAHHRRGLPHREHRVGA